VSLPDEQPSPPEEHRRRFRLSDLFVPLLIVLLILGVLELIPANEYMLLPGQALSVEPMIHIKGYPPLRTRGRLFMVDVTLYKVNHLLEEIYGKLDPNAELYPAQDVAGNMSEKQYLKYNVQLMDTSQQSAEAAALSVARGYKAPVVVELAYILPTTPAARVLHPGDIVTAIDGHAIHDVTQVRPLVRSLRPGQYVNITVQRAGVAKHFRVRTVPSRNGVPNKRGNVALVGISVQDVLKRSTALPIKMSIDAGNIGGPSAGLMFTLGIIERLERRDIAHGCQVAGTGTIDFNGAVGPIGGARQKVIAAGRAGARYFFVPNDSQDVHDAMAGRGSIKVIPVGSLQQAMGYLNRLAPCT
jgi:PDZ domain-containing protein